MDLIIYYQVSSLLLQEESHETNFFSGSTYNKYLCSSVRYVDQDKEINFLNNQLHGLVRILNMIIIFNRGEILSYESSHLVYKKDKLMMTINDKKVNLILVNNIITNDHELRRIGILEPRDRVCEVKVHFNINTFKMEVELIRHRYN